MYYNLTLKAFKNEPVAFFSSLSLILFINIFSVWTLVHTAATFCHIPWNVTVRIALVAFICTTILTIPMTVFFWKAYSTSLVKSGDDPFLPPLAAVGIVCLATCLFFLPSYIARFLLAGTAFLYWAFRAQKKSLLPRQKKQTCEDAPRFELLIFIGLLISVFLFTICSYRSDPDDCEYIQIALQTLQHPERAPLTFDSSLGYIIDTFRFPPYRFTSYENFVAFFADIFSTDVMNIYYFLLPATGSVLCMCCAYLFSRWFLSRHLALTALFIFFLVMIAWGETHLSFGNRVFVRLYQGKGWLVAINAPFVVLCGLILMREHQASVWLCYIAGNIAGVGVSSSGVVLMCGVALLLSPLAFAHTLKKSAANFLILASGLGYPLLCGIALAFKFPGVGNLPSPYLPIVSSLGEVGRQCVTLSMLAFSACIGGSDRQKQFFLLVGSILFLILNPWLSSILAHYSSHNVSWRFAWAAPIPIVLSILVACFFNNPLGSASFSTTRKSSLLAGFCVIGIFLSIAPWTCRPGNLDFHFSFPQWKLPTNYGEIQQIANLTSDTTKGESVLMPSQEGSWMPVIRPEIRIIMPGHGYPLVLNRILSPQDFQDRLDLQNITYNFSFANISTDKWFHLLLKYNVKYIVIAKGEKMQEIHNAVNNSTSLKVKAIKSTDNLEILYITDL